MGNHDHSQVARAFFKEAHTDLRSARLLRDGGEYSRAVAACQQAVEKAATRYPLFGRVDLPIWTPSEQYGEDDANEAIADAEFVIEAIVAFVKRTYQLEL